MWTSFATHIISCSRGSIVTMSERARGNAGVPWSVRDACPFSGCPKGRNAARFSNTANAVLWGRPCLALHPVRAFAFGQGVRGTALGGVRPWNRLLERVVREWNSPQHCFRL